jgi:lysophospholipid acyltransferase (LPLAT)-like uncharacterized protein
MLKRILRSRAVQGALTALAASYLRLIAHTTRWQVEGGDIADAAWRSGNGVCLLLWHGRFNMLYSCWPRDVAVRPATLSSRSRDGDLGAGTAQRLGATVIRGSTRRQDRAKDKGGEDAYRRMIAHVEGGGVMCLTPDGPRGPRMRVSSGAPRLARQTQAQTLCLGLSVQRRIVLNTWDRMVIPLPFGRGAIVWDGPVAPPVPEADVESVRAEMEARLIAVSRRADALAGAPIIDPAPPRS